MGFNMEIMYVPVASILQKRDMMIAWRETSKRAMISSFVLAALCFVGFICFLNKEIPFGWLHIASGVLFAFSGVLSRKWNAFGYVLPFFAAIINAVASVLAYSADKNYFISSLAVGVVSLAPLFFHLKCLYNYKGVFLELKKSAGFPNFIANSADIYADKIYLKDKKKTQYESTTTAAHNNFNTEEDIRKEEFIRSQGLKAKGEKKVIVENIGEPKHEAPSAAPEFLKSFSMEIAYVPATSVFEKKSMMIDWKQTSKLSAIMGCVFAVFCFLVSGLNSNFGDLFEFSLIGTGVALIAAAVLCGKWSPAGYWINVGAVFLYNTISVFKLKDFGFDSVLLFIFGNLAAVGVLYFSLRCIYNYKNVFLELKKSPNFPSFIVNSADIYGEKIYLRDKDESLPPQKPVEKPKLYMDIGTEDQVKEQAKDLRKKKGKAILGIDLIFPHYEIVDMKLEDKKGFMFYWNENIKLMSRFIFVSIFLMMGGALFSFIAEANGGGGVKSLIIGYGSIILLFLGTNYMKMGKMAGVVLTLAGLGLYFYLGFYIGGGGNGIPLAYVTVTSIFNGVFLFPMLRFVLNYRIFKELSHHDGFPSFIKTYSDLYGDKLYIVEKKAPVKRQSKTKDGMIVMDIGYDEKPKKDDGPWNAFDYRDKLNENEEDSNENNS